MDTKTIILLITGLIFLLASGKFLVESSVVIARHFKIPTSIIGLTIVSLGTSAPELLVSIQAAIQGHPDMAVGNVIGSNISNILLVLALTAIIFPLVVQKESIVHDWPIMMFVTILLAFFLMDMEVKQWEGIVFIGILLAYILYSIVRSRRRPDHQKENSSDENYRWEVAILIFLVSCAGLAFGADLLVDNASKLASHIGVSERVISITMVALGTSLPELATSIIAAFKKQTEISIGNILGSNMMNILAVLGITSIIKPIQTVDEVMQMDVPWMLGTAILLLLFMLPARKGRISRLEGIIMVAAYTSYIYIIFMS